MKNSNYFLPKILSFFIYFFPFSFILGNFVVNVTLTIISVLGIVYYKNKIFKFKNNKPLILIIIFFILVFVSTLVELGTKQESGYLLKSLLFFRYLIFMIVVRCMFLSGDINFKKFFLFCMFLACFAASDVIFQYFVGIDFFGIKPKHFLSGMFGEEAIAGGYIQRFAVLGCFSVPWLFNKNYRKSFPIFFLLLAICFFGTIISGNRVPTLMLILFFLLVSIIFAVKKINYTRMIISLMVIGSLVLGSFVIILSNNPVLKNRYHSIWAEKDSFYEIIPELKRSYPELEKYKNKKSWPEITDTEEYKILSKDRQRNLPQVTGHTQIWITSLDIFMDDPILGRGIKSFRYTCYTKLHLPNRTCQSHPHHFYLEILNDTGIIGLVILLTALFMMFVKNFKKYFIAYSRGNLNLIFYAIIFALVIEFFPFRSHGSFFSVWNAAYVFFLIGIKLYILFNQLEKLILYI